MKTYFGKYRGTVLNNVDPMQTGRILAQCPAVTGLLPTTWVTPCVPIAGTQAGMYVVPTIGSAVWIEFEAGDLRHPIWSGGFWGSVADVPALALAGVPASPSLVLQTQGQNTLAISDLPGPAGGLLLKGRTGAFISISEAGIIISNGQGAIITMTGPVVTVNSGALVVT